MSQPARLMLVSTPRTGNTWLRCLLKGMYDLPSIESHALGETEWATMPAKVVYQSHWPHSSDLTERAKHHGVRLVTIARHPLDVLLSILHFCQYEPETRHWLLGDGGDEATLHKVTPGDRAFLKYATSPRAKALLNVTASWWQRPEVIRVRYEDLVADTVKTLQQLTRAIGRSPAGPLRDVIAVNSLENARRTSLNNHFWQGRPGLWRQLLTASQVRTIQSAHAEVFATLGYDCDADRSLSGRAARANWAACSLAGRNPTQVSFTRRLVQRVLRTR